MAVVIQEDFRGHPPRSEPGMVQGILSVAGAVTSVALVIGLGMWGYDLAMRDVSGVPVVRALSGPMRMAPPEPGGTVMANTGLSVNELVGEGAAASLPDQVVLAPQPGELSVEDQPVDPAAAALAADGSAQPVPGAGQAGAQTALTVPVAPVDQPAETALAGSAAADRDQAMESSVEAALAEALGADPMQADELAMAAAAPPGAMLSSPRPERRPEGDGSAEPVITAPQAKSPDAAPAGNEVQVASITPGTPLVQLGAFDNEADARREWAGLQAKFGDLMAPKAMVLQTAESGGRIFVRLRAMGFEDQADARRFCSALLAENASCIPVAHRV